MEFEMPVDNHNKHADGAEQQKSPLSLYQSQISHNDASDGGKKARQNINDTEHVKRGQPLFVVSILNQNQLPSNIADFAESTDNLCQRKHPKAVRKKV